MTTGHAHGAVTVLNATATGRGASLATEAGVEATWTWTDGDGLDWQGATDDRLAQACFRLVADGRTGATASTTSAVPPSRGLKTSSSAAAALVRAAEPGLPDADVERLAVQAARDAGVTLTGAYDDQVATVRGGCHLTDNARNEILLDVPVEPWHVALWIPDAKITKSALRSIDASVLAPRIEAAEASLRDGDVPGALRQNGAAFLGFYEALGQPVTDAPVEVAHATGALGAGLSGTGPAVAALFDAVCDLPAVSGGTWSWTRVVP